jgi:hypothetical protein
MPRLIPLPTKWPVEIVQSVSNVDAYLGQHCRELRGREGLIRMCEQPSRLRCACTAGVVASRCHIHGGSLAAGIFTALILDTIARWWWADPLAAGVVAIVALNEARQAFKQ